MFTVQSVLQAAKNSRKRLDDPALNALFDTYRRPAPPPRIDDPNYYRFIYNLAPCVSNYLELGCRTGAAAYHLLMANPNAKASCIDIKDTIAVYHPNLNFYLSDSRSRDLSRAFADKWFDMIFIDSDHTYDTTAMEYSIWKPKLKPGGILLFDDILAPEYPGLNKLWSELPGEKIVLPELHPDNWGFGVILC